MKLQTKEGIIFCSESILETSDKEEFLRAFHHSAKDRPDGCVHIDLHGVDRINSSGVKVFLEAIEQISKPIIVYRCPEIIVNQFNLLDEFWDHDLYIESFEARFICPGDMDCKKKILSVGKDIELKSEYHDNDVVPLQIGNKVYEPDFDPSYYFTFLTMQYQKSIERQTRNAQSG